MTEDYAGAALATERGDVMAIARQTLIVTDDGVPLDLEVWRTAPAPAVGRTHRGKVVKS